MQAMELRGLFVRIPAEQAEALDVACARLRTTKQALVGSMLSTQLRDGVGQAIPAPPAEPEPVLTLDEVVELLRLPADVVLRRVEAGEIPGRRFGEEWRFARHAVLDWLSGSDGAGRSTGFGAVP